MSKPLPTQSNVTIRACCPACGVSVLGKSEGECARLLREHLPVHHKRTWRDIEPADAVDVVLPHNGVEGPLTSSGERCPWPWDPQQLKGQPIGQYHCPYCGDMVIAGVAHPDYEESNPS